MISITFPFFKVLIEQNLQDRKTQKAAFLSFELKKHDTLFCFVFLITERSVLRSLTFSTIYIYFFNNIGIFGILLYFFWFKREKNRQHSRSD